MPVGSLAASAVSLVGTFVRGYSQKMSISNWWWLKEIRIWKRWRSCQQKWIVLWIAIATTKSTIVAVSLQKKKGNAVPSFMKAPLYRLLLFVVPIMYRFVGDEAMNW
jgi:hypothetical protein